MSDGHEAENLIKRCMRNRLYVDVPVSDHLKSVGGRYDPWFLYFSPAYTVVLSASHLSATNRTLASVHSVVDT